MQDSVVRSLVIVVLVLVGTILSLLLLGWLAMGVAMGSGMHQRRKRGVVFGTALWQMGFASSTLSGRQLRMNEIARLVDDLRATLAEFLRPATGPGRCSPHPIRRCGATSPSGACGAPCRVGS